MLDDHKYIKTKQWDKNNFGFYSLSDNIYYKKELSKSGILISNTSKILEVGFGNGNFLGFCQNKGWSAIGVESNLALVEKANTAGFSAIHSSEILTLSNESFDFIFAFDVIEHLEPEELVGFLQTLYGLLKSNGIIFLRFPNGDSPLSMYIQNGDITHKNFIGSGKISQVAAACNLKLSTINSAAYPLYLGGMLKAPFRTLKFLIRAIGNFLINLMLVNGKHVYFLSENLSVSLIKLD
jgi:2-polyprenyl-3-methyl-5-hydroxy-6-metoxy-1,4-benzoquinol methylase